MIGKLIILLTVFITFILFQELIGHFAHLVTILKDIECIIECVGIIANVNIPEVDFKELLESNNLISWMVQFVNNGMVLLIIFESNVLK